MKKIKMVVFDMDGTVLPFESGACSAETIKALEACKEAGIITSPCSGRSIFMIPEEIKKAINTKYVIYCNGAYIADPVTEEIADSNPVDKNKIIELFRKAQMDGVYHKLSTFHQFIDDNKSGMTFGTIPAIFVDDIYETLENLNEPLYKAEYFFYEDLSLREKIMDIIKDEKEFFFSSALPVNIEINNPKATKGQAIKRLAELYGFSLDEVMAIGDGDNDMTMLEAAGFFVAMGNGSDILKRKADAVTDTVDNEGFAKAIYKYVLNK